MNLLKYLTKLSKELILSPSIISKLKLSIRPKLDLLISLLINLLLKPLRSLRKLCANLLELLSFLLVCSWELRLK